MTAEQAQEEKQNKTRNKTKQDSSVKRQYETHENKTS